MSPWCAAAVLALASAEVQVSHRGVRADDGAVLGLVRYAIGAPREGSRRVLVVPELGFGRVAWDGAARRLAERGFVVYVAELRGQGGAWRPGYHLADLVRRDLPAVARALEADGAARFHLVAHGFAGTLALAASTVELAGRVRRALALSTPVDAQVPSALVQRFLEAGGRFATTGTDPEAARLFELTLGGGPRVRRDALQRVRARGLSNLGHLASAELLGWMTQGDLALGDGSTVLSRLERYAAPTWLVLPLDDGFASSEMAAPLREVTRAQVRTHALNRAEYLAEDYDHLSMVLGERAWAEIWRPAVAFLGQDLP